MYLNRDTDVDEVCRGEIQPKEIAFRLDKLRTHPKLPSKIKPKCRLMYYPIHRIISDVALEIRSFEMKWVRLLYIFVKINLSDAPKLL